MASIFTFDPDPPRVSSPWLALNKGQTSASMNASPSDMPLPTTSSAVVNLSAIEITSNTRLEAEPQEGPTEYKLHLLLRPRRSLSSTSTGKHIAGSQHSKSMSSTPRSVSEVSLSISPPVVSSNGTRQHRLEQLTTQLLWRLQQSSPYHSTSANNLILPSLPEAKTELQAPDRPAKLLPGLEESKGALYEIGVSDDGTLVGLTVDEMNESLNNLRAMAGSLGCSVEILRMVCVGDCEWVERMDDDDDSGAESKMQSGKLYVAEAYVKPELRQSQSAQVDSQDDQPANSMAETRMDYSAHHSSSSGQALERREEQLRVSLTGATTCGKSSLLGTLSTSTLDNSRGKSRLSLLKHRHEIASGMTSSVSQELVGYHDEENSSGGCIKVVNYATENVSSWTDIHAASESSRLALLSDSAGHPRYRRTTVRGLVGWAPHWIFLCIAANEDPIMTGQNSVSSLDDAEPAFSGANAHISIAHLDLCLRLQVPLAVIVTKFDLATKSGFRLVLSTLLTRLKEAGRKPEILSNDGNVATEDDLQTVSRNVSSEVGRLTELLEKCPLDIVPIIFTSAVKGTGIAKLHALLRHLPIPAIEVNHENRHQSQMTGSGDIPTITFHIDDLFNLPVGKIHGTDSPRSSTSAAAAAAGSVLSGYLASGTISVGDILHLGPFSEAANAASSAEDVGVEGEQASSSNFALSSGADADGFLTPRSFDAALIKVTSSPRLKSLPAEREWRPVKVASVRNLRMPVHTLQTDQVGTIGILPANADADPCADLLDAPDTSTATTSRRRGWPLPIRKGMVLASSGTQAPPSSAHTFTASFAVAEASSIVVSTVVVVACASVRTTARVVAISLEDDARARSQGTRRQRSTSPSRSPSSSSSSLRHGAANVPVAVGLEDEDREDYAFGFDFDEDAGPSDDEGGTGRNSDHDHDHDHRARGHQQGTSTSGTDTGAGVESILATFRLMTYREFLEIGAKVLIMPGGGPGPHPGSERGGKGLGLGLGGVGFEGFGLVGKIVRTFG